MIGLEGSYEYVIISKLTLKNESDNHFHFETDSIEIRKKFFIIVFENLIKPYRDCAGTGVLARLSPISL
jgi:hypothetical protein